MAIITDLEIKSWITSKDYFETRAIGGGLNMQFRKTFTTPVWIFRYSIAGLPRKINIGSYANISLAEARKQAKELTAAVTLGRDPQTEKQAVKRKSVADIARSKMAETVSDLCDEYYQQYVLGKVKHPKIILGKINNDIRPRIGKLNIVDIVPMHISAILQAIVKRGSPTASNDVLRLLKRIFDVAIKRHIITTNPATAFDVSDAGGKEKKRDRNLTRTEIAKLFQAMKDAKDFSRENQLAVKILLATCVRKSELTEAKWEEFNTDTWNLPAERTKTKVTIAIPLAPIVQVWLDELKMLSMQSEYVLPARKMGKKMKPHISPDTINVALKKINHGIDAFTVHDLRRTGRTLLSSLGVKPHIAERCLNHAIKGVAGIYDQHDYLDERKVALNGLADLLTDIDNGGDVIPIRANK